MGWRSSFKMFPFLSLKVIRLTYPYVRVQKSMKDLINIQHDGNFQEKIEEKKSYPGTSGDVQEW